MKKLLLSFGAVALSLSMSFAQQYDLRPVLAAPSPAANSVQAPGVYEVGFDIFNDGPASVNSGDTIWFGYFIGNDLFDSDGVANGVNGIILPTGVDLEAGASIPWLAISAVYDPFTANVSGVTSEIDVCAWIAGVNSSAFTPGGDPNDANTENNFSCFDIDPSLANVVNISLLENVNVSYNSGQISINILNGDNANYTVVSLTGQIMAQGSFAGHVAIDTDSFAKGIYIVNVDNSVEVKTVKLSVN